ncbi:MAG TPA: glycosyltransferase [Telluria sp.]|nr:glycosyltransferase [Telluria sp.]
MKMETPVKARSRSSKATPPSSRWHGALEGIHRGLVYGWAIDTDHPNARVVLEVCLNDEPLRSVIADVVRTDLTSTFTALIPGGPADSCHGFIVDIGTDEKFSGTLTVRIANGDQMLAGAACFEALPEPPISATSNVAGNGALRLHGWAVDTRDERRTVTVSAYCGSRKVAESKANLNLPGLRSKDIGQHGFTLDLPLDLGDGRLHEIRVVDEAGIPLNGSPVTICTFAEGMRSLLPESGSSLVGDVVETYERYLPRSLGFQYYAEWTRRFAPATPPLQALTVALVVTGSTESESVKTTLASIKAQAGVKIKAFAPTTAKAKFGTLLEAALAAGCDVIGCIRAGDTLAPDALALALNGFENTAAQVVYTDSEFDGKPWFKPAWNRDYAYATDYPLELMLVRSTSARNATNAADFAWSALAAASAHGDDAIVHVPHVLYQFNSTPTAAEKAERTAACASAAQTIEPQVSILPEAKADPLFQPRRAVRRLTKAERSKTVSLIIPTRDHADMLERCITSIKAHTDWPNLDIIVIDNGSTDAKTKTYFRALAKQGVRVLPMPGAFNFADLNNRAVAEATGEIVGLINNDIEALHPNWLDEIVGQLLRPNVIAVGAKLLWPNGMVQHGGVLMGVGNAAGHFGNQLAGADWGDHGRNQLVQQVTGVTAACLFLRRADYLSVGGMDAHSFPVAFNDVDLCLKLRATGKLITWTPHAKLLHAESASRGNEDSPQKLARARRELDGLRKRWGEVLLRDPSYHPSLNLDVHGNAFGGLALPPRDRSPRTPTVIPAATVIPAHPGTHAEQAAAVTPIKKARVAKPATRVRKSKQA